jgi:hypothetical protein
VEGLIAILVDAIGAVIAPLIATAVTGLAWLLGVVLELVWLVIELLLPRLAAKRRAQPPTGGPQPPAPKRRRWRRVVFMSVASLSLLLGLAIGVVELWFSDDVLAYGLRRWQDRTGVELSYRITRCSLLRGRATLEQVHVASPRDPAMSYDLTVARVEVDLSMRALLHGLIEVEDLHVTGVRGRYAADLDAPRAGIPHRERAADPGAPRAEVPRRDYVIAHGLIEDLAVDVELRRRGRSLAGPLTVERWETAPLRRSTALFDSLFRTQAKGTVLGAPFTIASAPADHGRTTRWSAQGVPADLLAAYLGGPFAWIDAGRIDVDVDDAWSLDAPKYIRMHWRMSGHGLSLVPAEELDGISRRMVAALTPLLERRNGELELSFETTIDPDRFTTAYSLDAAALGEIVSSAATESLARELGWEPEQVRNAAQIIKDLGKQALERWRKKHGDGSKPRPADPP